MTVPFSNSTFLEELATRPTPSLWHTIFLWILPANNQKAIFKPQRLHYNYRDLLPTKYETVGAELRACHLWEAVVQRTCNSQTFTETSLVGKTFKTSSASHARTTHIIRRQIIHVHADLGEPTKYQLCFIYSWFDRRCFQYLKIVMVGRPQRSFRNTVSSVTAYFPNTRSDSCLKPSDVLTR